MHVTVDNENEVLYKPKWKNNNANVFVQNLNDGNIQCLIEKLDNLDFKNIDANIVNEVVVNCNSIIKNAADKADMIVECKPKTKPNVQSLKRKPYFNQDCYLKRKEYRKCKNLHWRFKRAETKVNLISSSREYKRTLNKQFREYQKAIIEKLKNLRKSDSKALVFVEQM